MEHTGYYALVSHESAVEAIWTLAARKWSGVLDDESIWLVPKAELCIKTQGEFKRLAREVDLPSLGIRGAPADLLVPTKSCYSRGKQARFHVWTDSFPANSFVRVHDRVFISTPYFAVLQLATAHRANRLAEERARASAAEDARIRGMLGIEEAAATADELVRWENIARFVRAAQVLTDFMGTYRYVPPEAEGRAPGLKTQTKPLITSGSFDSYLAKMKKAKGVQRARAVSAAAFANAASPMETILALMLALPTSMGGFGLPRPELNRDIPIEPSCRDLVSQDTITPDLSWSDKKICIEYHGWDTHFGAGPRKVASDAARANSLSALGWTVLHVTFEQVKTLAGISLLSRQLARLLGAELTEPTDLELVWRTRLFELLLPNQQLAGE